MSENRTLPKNVGVWIRVSSEDQAKGESPAHHLERARNYAALRGWTIIETYNLAGVSGKSVREHPECQRMESDIKRGHISGLIFSKLARLARNTQELLTFSDKFRESNADLISIAETIDTSTPAGRLFFTIIAAMATWEREEIADRQKASVRIRASLGKTINGRAPYGYHWKDRKLVSHPDEAPIRRQAYELFLKYRRKGTVAKMLNAAGHRTRNGVAFRDCNVTRMLTCSSAKGVYYFNRIRKDGPWKGTEKPEEEWGEAQCDPIISEDSWNDANKIVEEQLKQWKKPGKMPVNPFGNRLWCQCGGKMYERKHTGKFHCRTCNRKVPIADFENEMRQELHRFYNTPQQVELHMENAKKNIAENEQALASLQRQIQKVRDEMNHMMKLSVEGQITPQGFGRFYKPAEERLNQLLSEQPKLEANVAHLKVKQVSAEDVMFEAQRLYEQWPKMETDRKRSMIESVFERIEAHDGKIRIKFSNQPTSEELCKNQQQMAPARC